MCFVFDMCKTLVLGGYSNKYSHCSAMLQSSYPYDIVSVKGYNMNRFNLGTISSFISNTPQLYLIIKSWLINTKVLVIIFFFFQQIVMLNQVFSNVTLLWTVKR